MGYFHIDMADVQTEEGKLSMFVAIDRTSKFIYAELHPRTTRMITRDFIDKLTQIVPYKIHTILTNNGIQFAQREGTEDYWFRCIIGDCRVPVVYAARLKRTG